MTVCPHCGKSIEEIKVGKSKIEPKYVIIKRIYFGEEGPFLNEDKLHRIIKKIPGAKNYSATYGEYEDAYLEIKVATVDKRTANKVLSEINKKLLFDNSSHDQLTEFNIKSE